MLEAWRESEGLMRSAGEEAACALSHAVAA